MFIGSRCYTVGIMTSKVTIIIDDKSLEIEVSDKGDVSVRDVLILGQKPESDVEGFDLLKVQKDGRDVIVYSKREGEGSLEELIHVESGDKFIIKPSEGGQGYVIIVDTQEKSWNKDVISYEEVVGLSASAPYIIDNPDISYTIVYYDDPSSEGMSLVRGKTVQVKSGMIFNVTKTDKS